MAVVDQARAIVFLGVESQSVRDRVGAAAALELAIGAVGAANSALPLPS